MSRPRRRVLLVQLPIPQPGMAPAKGNVALAAGYLALMARLRGLDADYQIEILPTREANELSDQGLVATILDRQPDLVGFTCYLWNVNRTLFVAERLKAARPDLFVLLGGPEITADNAWVLSSPCVDFAAIGEGEQTFVELLAALRDGTPPVGIPGLFVQRPPRRVLPPLRKGG
ncbi:MAG: cobalamin B12-binding domain-containing protein, partial [Planctomycetia bacterium]|nr:cobalamin B12-binding domain-containing protein [Planctomycetia bacterium]